MTGASQAMGKSALGRLEISRERKAEEEVGLGGKASVVPLTPTPLLHLLFSEFTPGPGSVLSPG